MTAVTDRVRGTTGATRRDAAASTIARGAVNDLLALPPSIRRECLAGLPTRDLTVVLAASLHATGSSYGLWQDDPVGFTEDVLGETMWSRQRDVLAAIPTAKKIAVPAGFGLGKTHLAARAVTWFVCTNPVGTATAVTTATRMRQVQRQLWPHIRKVVARAGLPGSCDTVQWKMRDRNDVETVVAYGFTAPDNDESAMQGIHCFDDQTELLTDQGWKKFEQVSGDERVLTLNGDTAEWGPITEVIRSPYDGYLNLYNNSRVSFCITDNHRLLARGMHYAATEQVRCRYCDRAVGAKGIARHEGTHRRAGDTQVRAMVERVGEPTKRWRLAPYADLPDEFFVRRTNTWGGSNPDTVTFDAPPRRPGRRADRLVPYTFAFSDWCEFLGWYVAEGYVGARNRLGISQLPGAKYEQIAAVLTRMGVLFHRNERDLRFTSGPIAAWLAEHCGVGSENKRIPLCVKEATPAMIRIFLNAFRQGDGARHTHPGSARYVTSSRRLADDLHEVLAKIGTARKLRMMHPAGSDAVGPQGRAFTRRRATWMVNEAGRPSDSNVKKANVERVRYTGTVYCVSTPLETIMVRRNGCPMWSGNSAKLLLVVDEAGGIGRLIGSSTNNLLTGDARMLAIGNPPSDDEGSWFEGLVEDGEDPERRDTVTVRIAATDSPAVTGEDAGVCSDCPPGVPAHSLGEHLVDGQWIADAIRDHGPDSGYVIAKVHAKFPKGGSQRIIPSTWVEAAAEEVEPDGDEWVRLDSLGLSWERAPWAVRRGAWIRLGVDIAADGGDEFVIARAAGDLLTVEHVSSGSSNASSVDVAGVVLGQIRRAAALAAAIGSAAAVRVKIDAIGVGWGVAGTLTAWGTEGLHGAEIVPVIVSESTNRSPDGATMVPYRKRDELWISGRELMEPPAGGGLPLVRLRVDGRTRAQLSAPDKGTTSGGLTTVESKKSMKARGVSSPDRAEAVLLASYEPAPPPSKRKKVRIIAGG